MNILLPRINQRSEEKNLSVFQSQLPLKKYANCFTENQNHVSNQTTCRIKPRFPEKCSKQKNETTGNEFVDTGKHELISQSAEN